MNNSFYISANKSEAEVSELGGKGFTLDCMSKQKLPVPSWYAITASAFKDTIANSGDLAKELQTKFNSLDKDMSPDEIENELQELRKRILTLELDEEFCKKLETTHNEIIGETRYFSVRSSAIDEDGGDASFAGMHDSFMYVSGLDDLKDKIRMVWKSLLNTRAVIYRLKNELPLKDISIAIVVQEMVDAESSGVMFTANPNSGNVKEVVISSLWGAGEGLVSAGLEADTFTLDKFSNEIDSVVASKEFQMLRDADSGFGLLKNALDEKKKTSASLSNDILLELLRLGLKIERFYGCPQDIEFCVEADKKVKVLQTRPITTVKEYGPAAGNRMIWDNSNIVESYSGPTSPMTFSFIRRAYTIVYHCFSEVMGIPPKQVRENSVVFENMLGLIQGQVYYNIFNWYKLVEQFPGFNYNKGFMESMMGVKEKTSTDSIEKKASAWQRYFVELPKLVKLILRSMNNFRKIDSLVYEFDSHFRKHYDHWEKLDMSQMTPYELMENYQKMEAALLWNWKAPIINDFYVMIHYGVLKKLCSKWCGDEHGSLQNDLICGEGDIESTCPTRMLMDLSRKIKADEKLKSLFEAMSVKDLMEKVKTDVELEWVQKKIDFYLKEYGFRCINELKLEEPSLREMPDFVFQMIKNYLKMDDDAINPAIMEAREQEIRQKAEEQSISKLSFLKKPVFKHFVKNSRKGVRNRENMRFARTRIYGKIRESLNQIGCNFKREGLLDCWNDIYYLTMDEVWDYIKGTAVCTNLRGLAELRKKEFEFYNSPKAPEISDRFDTYGMVYHRNLFKNYSKAPEAVEGQLQGIGCSPGIVEKEVRVLHSPQDGADLNGEILVAGRTDPGWVPLYPAVSGILIERGSILSHSAIVAREMGIPTIVGIPDLMKTVENGQKVKMDGSSGIVEI